jgi:nucleoside-diphosphate-sugar epimerase
MIAAPIVVTGATGFLGRVVVTRLAARYDVLAVQRTAAEPQPQPQPRVHGVQADLGPGWTAHLTAAAGTVAWLAQSRRYRDFPDGAADMFRVNEAALFDALEWSREHGVRRFLYASSGSVYAPSREPLREDSPTAAATFYAATKLNGEQLVRQYATFFEVVILRVFALYGLGQHTMAMGRVMQAVAEGRPVDLAGGIGMTFTPIHVADAAWAVEGLLGAALPGRCVVVNLAGPERATLAQVATEAARHRGVSPNVRATEQEAPFLVADTALLRGLLPDFTCRPLAAGVAETLGVC